MSCFSCKKKNTSVEVTETDGPNIVFRLFYFLVGVVVVLILGPVLTVIGLYMLFNSMVLNRGTDIMPSVTFVARLLTRKDKEVDDEEEDYDEEYDSDEYELVGVEEIRKIDV